MVTLELDVAWATLVMAHPQACRLPQAWHRLLVCNNR